MSRHHELHASPDTVHWGCFGASIPPVLRVQSGDHVTLHCVNGDERTLPAAPFSVLPEQRDIHAKCRQWPRGHILNGPIYVEGAEPGDTLEVRILDVKLRQDWGWNLIRPLAGTIPEDFPFTRLMH